MLYRVNSIAQTSAYQLQKTDIRVNTICPGLIETGMTSVTFEYARKRGSEGKIGQLNALGRFGIAQGLWIYHFKMYFFADFGILSAIEIANAALFLASGKLIVCFLVAMITDFQFIEDDSSYVNGQNIAVDGGLSASHPVVPGRWAWASLMHHLRSIQGI